MKTDCIVVLPFKKKVRWRSILCTDIIIKVAYLCFMM